MTIAEIFANDMRGAAYIAARGLSPQIVKAQQHQCDTCKKAELLPAVIQIVNNWPIKAKQMRRVK